MTPDDFAQLLATVTPIDPFRDFLGFAWETGAWPQEVRHIEPRHIDVEGECKVMPNAVCKLQAARAPKWSGRWPDVRPDESGPCGCGSRR